MVYYLPILGISVGTLIFLRKIELSVRGKKTALYIFCVFLQLAIAFLGLPFAENIIFNPNNRKEWLDDLFMYPTMLISVFVVMRQIDYRQSKKDKRNGGVM